MIESPKLAKYQRPIQQTICLVCFLSCGGCGIFGSPVRSKDQDVRFAESSSAATIAFDGGDVGTASKLFAAALARARAMDDSTDVADAAYNLAVCETVLGQYDSASHHLYEAKYARISSGASTDEILLLMAKVAYLRQHDADAETIAQSLNGSSSAVNQLQAQVLLTLISCDLGKVSEAQARLAKLQEMQCKVPGLSPSVAADIAKAQGAVANIEGREHEAAECFDREVGLLRVAHRYRDTIHALSRSAAMHDAAGEFTASADRYYRAAEGCWAVNDSLRARELAQNGLAAAKAAQDVQLQELIKNLLDELPPATGP